MIILFLQRKQVSVVSSLPHCAVLRYNELLTALLSLVGGNHQAALISWRKVQLELLLSPDAHYSKTQPYLKQKQTFIFKKYNFNNTSGFLHDLNAAEMN